MLVSYLLHLFNSLCFVHLLFVRHLIKHKFNFGSNFKNFKLKESSGCVCTFLFASSCLTLYNLLVRMFFFSLFYFLCAICFASVVTFSVCSTMPKPFFLFLFCFFLSIFIQRMKFTFPRLQVRMKEILN